MTAPVISTVNEIVAPSPRVSGGVLFAPLGTPLPTDATGPLDAAFVTLGRVKDDGIKRTEDRSSSNVYDWGGNRIAILQTQFGISVMFDLLQLVNAEVQSAAHGEENVDVTPATATSGTEIAVKINPKLLDTGVWVFDSYYGKASGRLVLPYARPTKVDGPNWTHKELASYKMTLESMPDDDGNHALEFWNDGILA
jgi:hypothetical protein